MGRKKQIRPHRSVGTLETNNYSAELKVQSGILTNGDEDSGELDTPFFVEVDRNSIERYDVAEIILSNLKISEEFYGYVLNEGVLEDTKYLFRFRLWNVNQYLGRMKLGHWPVLSANDIYFELIEKKVVEDEETNVVLVAGCFEGPNEGVSALVHLASIKFLTLRPITGVTLDERCSTLRIRVGILKSAFDVCESLFDNTRGVWRRSMLKVMAWLRPEVMTSEARYGYSLVAEVNDVIPMDTDESSSAFEKGTRFDADGFYEAIKPSKEYPMLEDEMPDLLPKLRPYQRRAAHWMVQREKGGSECCGGKERDQFISPLCTPVNLIDSCSTIFYNSFSGSVSLHPEDNVPYVCGGILADEMGLGKTVEVLACIFAHQMSTLEAGHVSDEIMQVSGDQNINIKRIKKERVECVCGAVSESSKYEELWVQCDMCDAWQHADCVGYSNMAKTSKSIKAVSKERGFRRSLTDSSKRLKRSKRSAEVVVDDQAHICQICSELMQVADSPIVTGATLIVCPAPILPQWHSEIVRHTKSGSLKTCVYEGVRNTSISNASFVDIDELLTADIVLTTYDVLKDDLSHDSDRHEGDRRFLRFQKRYPVIPTSLTRLFWWRVCLDEAQMVESNVASATEMALRLHAKHRWCITGTPIQRKLDDLYGLLRFLKVIPYDVIRWWAEVVRDPYENGDAGAMVFTHKFFKNIMWRSSKMHIAEELQIPPQEERISWISLSPIEENFYQRQYETCVGYAREIMSSCKENVIKRNITGPKSSDALSDYFVTHVEAAKLLNSLLKLRQACCHPQVGSSGLRSLQQSPMTMEEILSVLVGKTKVEGEEALRRVVVSLNALAAIAAIKQDFSQSVSLYKEALTLVDEHSEDFRLDPLLNIHLHHNLTEILLLTPDFLNQFHSDCECLGSSECKVHEICDEECHHRAVKKIKVSRELSSDMAVCRSTSNQCLRMASENLKKKFLSVFTSKLSLAQEEFRKSYDQVSNILTGRKNKHTTWWLDTLHCAEQNKDTSSELIRKVGEAVSGTLNTSRASRISSRFQSITALKYYLQTALDSLEDSRKSLIDRLVEIDKRMGNPREEDIQRVRYCPNCYSGDGVMCLHCELDDLFQVYEARLFRLTKSHDGGLITSAEEAVDLQKKKSALNQFYWKLSQAGKNSASSSVSNENDGRKRDAGDKVMVSKAPSEVEVILGIMKSYSKALLGGEVMSAASKHLLLLEGMRKEYSQARSLATAQAQVLRAHDEIKMATSRLRLRENENDKSVDALALGDLDPASVEYSSEKFVALSTLSRIKGQLRYLKGLVQSKGTMKNSSPSHVKDGTPNMERLSEDSEETCPVCQEKLSTRKMVFQCGHITCCKCLFAMIDQRKIQHAEFQSKWVHCPTCRRPTEFGNIAYVDDGLHSSYQDTENSFENSISVRGSYSTKIEAVTKRILWINSTNPKAKVLVFSSWNDVLDVLQHAFAANNISYIRMQGGRKSHVAISRFKGEQSGTRDNQPEMESVQVLLILIQHGANGLNLLEAQHVILVEPLLNPAAESQAISRVHRIGQKNKTIVHRFIVQNTVEESIYKLNKSRNTASSYTSANKKNLDQPLLTLKDLESIFKVSPFSEAPEAIETQSESLRHLPPSLAAAISAERRLTT